MRNEQEMYELILGTAREDERIRAVYMNGSRTNINAPADIFQDYDVVYVVSDTGPFMRDRSWIDRFGERLFMQYPEGDFQYLSKDAQSLGEAPQYPADMDRCYGWLMQFADGNRLDLHVVTLDYALETILEDRLCRILLDKDSCLPDVGEATNQDYWVKLPDERTFLDTCNEFWWCLDNVAKGLWRQEIPYAQDMVNLYVRPQLTLLLSWKVGIRTGFSVSVGKCGKYLYRWLTPGEWAEYLATYGPGNVNGMWEAAEVMCRLFDRTARLVGRELGVHYDEKEAENCMAFLRHVRQLPGEAREIY